MNHFEAHLQGLVHQAAQRLDDILPGWEDYVNPNGLVMYSSRECVLGQLAREMPRAQELTDQLVTRDEIGAYVRSMLSVYGPSFSTLLPVFDRNFPQGRRLHDAFVYDLSQPFWAREIAARQANNVERVLDQLLAGAKREPEPVSYPVFTARELVSA